MESLFNNVNHLIECQRFVVERVYFLEQKRLEISSWITKLGHSKHKLTLENKIDQLEVRITKAVDVETEMNKKRLCSNFSSSENMQIPHSWFL